MKPLRDTTEHYWLVQRMAKALDRDLPAAMSEGRLESGDWAAMVERCRGCEVTCACRDWLDRAEIEGEARAKAIRGCENALVFDRI